ncbi:hypothetical protein GOBAR_DD16255 [Gossypium barbadense]|nr:hypothetical protein GOBAR_DD16255 [Gossypium barbadense]
MGDNLCRNFPFPAPSLHPLACVPELTQTNLDFSDSGVTIESFRDPVSNCTTVCIRHLPLDKYLIFLNRDLLFSLLRKKKCILVYGPRDLVPSRFAAGSSDLYVKHFHFLIPFGIYDGILLVVVRFKYLSVPLPSVSIIKCILDILKGQDDWLEPSRIILQLFGVPEDWMGQTMVWTNEKHNTYLDSLEASFVKQLHYSKSLHGCHPQVGMREPCLFPQLLVGHNSSHQFSILQDGCGQKINYESNDPLLESTADSGAVLGSPWLHHFRSAGKCSSITFPVPRKIAVPNDEICSRSNTNFYCKSAVNSKHNPIVNSCNHSLDSCTAALMMDYKGRGLAYNVICWIRMEWTKYFFGWEVSDQNFVAEDHGEKTSYASGAKRMKMMTVLDASSDSQIIRSNLTSSLAQVAPVGNLHTIDDSIISNISAKRGKKKLLSDHPERLTCPKSDTHYFLRES